MKTITARVAHFTFGCLLNKYLRANNPETDEAAENPDH